MTFEGFIKGYHQQTSTGSDQIHRTRLQFGPDFLSSSIKRSRVRFDIRVRLEKMGSDYPETGKHPVVLGKQKVRAACLMDML